MRSSRRWGRCPQHPHRRRRLRGRLFSSSTRSSSERDGKPWRIRNRSPVLVRQDPESAAAPMLLCPAATEESWHLPCRTLPEAAGRRHRTQLRPACGHAAGRLP
jgi:hypothetical protein